MYIQTHAGLASCVYHRWGDWDWQDEKRKVLRTFCRRTTIQHVDISMCVGVRTLEDRQECLHKNIPSAYTGRYEHSQPNRREAKTKTRKMSDDLEVCLHVCLCMSVVHVLKSGSACAKTCGGLQMGLYRTPTQMKFIYQQIQTERRRERDGKRKRSARIDTYKERPVLL